MGFVRINHQGQIGIVDDLEYNKAIGIVSDFNYSPGIIEVILFPYTNNYKDIKTDNKINSRFDILDIR